MFKKHMMAGPKTDKVAHKGKGSQQVGLPDRGQITKLARGPMNGVNDYAKATPMPASMPPAPTGDFGGM